MAQYVHQAAEAAPVIPALTTVEPAPAARSRPDLKSGDRFANHHNGTIISLAEGITRKRKRKGETEGVSHRLELDALVILITKYCLPRLRKQAT